MTEPTINSLTEEPNGDSSTTKPEPRLSEKLKVLAVVVVAAIGLFFLTRRFFDLEYLSQIDSQVKGFYASNPLTVFSIAFLIYVLVTGFSIPGATLMSLVYAWFFGFWRGLILISFASTAGATLAFLLIRYLFRDWIRNRFGERLKTFNESLDKDGAFYLFTLRLVPVVPFFVINAVMGLTRNQSGNVLVGQPDRYAGGYCGLRLRWLSNSGFANACFQGSWSCFHELTTNTTGDCICTAGLISVGCKKTADSLHDFESGSVIASCSRIRK